MSINIHINADREIWVIDSNKKETQTISFDCRQTPTHESFQIMSSDNPLTAYRDWVINEMVSSDEEDRADIEKHLEEFDEWVDFCRQNGNPITVSSY